MHRHRPPAQDDAASDFVYAYNDFAKEPTLERVRVLRSLIATLPEAERRAFVHYYSDGLTEQESARRAGITPEAFSAVRANLRGQYFAMTGALCQ